MSAKCLSFAETLQKIDMESRMPTLRLRGSLAFRGIVPRAANCSRELETMNIRLSTSTFNTLHDHTYMISQHIMYTYKLYIVVYYIVILKQ